MNRFDLVDSAFIAAIAVFQSPLTHAMAALPGSPTQVRDVYAGVYMKDLRQSDVDELNSGLAQNNGDAAPNLLPTARNTPLFTEGSYYVIVLPLPSPVDRFCLLELAFQRLNRLLKKGSKGSNRNFAE